MTVTMAVRLPKFLSVTTCVFLLTCFVWGQYDIDSDEFSVSIEFDAGHYTFARPTNTFTPLSTYKGNTYFVWINDEFRPMVAKITNGEPTTAPLYANDDYKVLNDGHHHFSLGIDKNGYIHVVGDMHHYPTSNIDHLPSELKDGICLYWVSEIPEDITQFAFVGKDVTRAIPGHRFSYYAFQNDINMELYLNARIAVHKLGHHPGEAALGLFRYDAENRSWRALGGLPPTTDGKEAEFPAIIWEDNADGINMFYQAYMAGVRFDNNNRMHVATAVWDYNDCRHPTAVVYAFSDDGGESFYQADSTKIESLPIRCEPGPSQGDIIDRDTVEGFDSFVSVFFDKFGNPAVEYTVGNSHYRYWDPAIKEWSDLLTSPTRDIIRVKNHLDANGIITHVGLAGGLYRQTAFDQPLRTFHSGQNLVGIDELGLRETNVIRALSVENANDLPNRKMRIVKIVIDNISGTGTQKKDRNTSNESFRLNYVEQKKRSVTGSYSLAEASFVKMDLYSTAGKKIASILNEINEPGIHSFTWNPFRTGVKVPNGMYFMHCKVRTSKGFSIHDKQIVIK
jgi:hypothetical protein